MVNSVTSPGKNSNDLYPSPLLRFHGLFNPLVIITEDIALTRKLIKLGEDMDFRILDHFIVTEDEIISLKAIGLLDK